MPRKPRFNLPGVPQHVIQRGNNREPCFFSEVDYPRYLHDLAESSHKYHCEIHAYVLMTNHVHLLVTPESTQGVSQMMQALGRRYVKYINKTYRRTGSLWEGRFKSCLIDSESYLLACMRYIELNPVRAGMIEHPGEYKWSSYATNAQGVPNDLITAHALYMHLGLDEKRRQYAYRMLFQSHMDEAFIHDVRHALNHELVLGKSCFLDKVEAVCKRQTRLGHPGRPGVKESLPEYCLTA